MCNFKHFSYACLWACALLGCAEETASFVNIPVYTEGMASHTVQAGAWEVRLDKAEWVLGPVYFCASVSASEETCPTAQAEFTQSVRIDALNPSRVQVGTLEGIEGTVQSARYDVGWSWFGTHTAPTYSMKFSQVYSVHLQGQALNGTQRVDFDIAASVKPSQADTSSVYSASFVPFTITPFSSLTVKARVEDWVRALRFEDLASNASNNALVLSVSSGRTIFFTWEHISSYKE
jgi:hypothetical protein